MMDWLELTLDSCAANLAFDEALLLDAEEDRAGEILRLWEWPRFAVVLGSGCKLAEDVNEERCRADEVPILRRSSGGGTVLLGRGCLCFSLVLEMERSLLLQEIRLSYEFILGRVLSALNVPRAQLVGISDLAIDGCKFSGNAQQRKRRYLLHHGTLLYDFPLEAIACYLRLPVRQPEYREGRSHDDFVRQVPLDATTIKKQLRTVWQAGRERVNWPGERVAHLVRERYGVEEWIKRR